jgi:hypothetical protein
MTIQDMRQDWVTEASHSVYLEGLMVSSEYNAASEEYVAGEISADELVRMTRARFGLV